MDFTTLLLALGFFTLTLALIGPALNAHISQFAGEHQGTVMGLNSAASSLGRVVGPLLAGPSVRPQRGVSVVERRGDAAVGDYPGGHAGCMKRNNLRAGELDKQSIHLPGNP